MVDKFDPLQIGCSRAPCSCNKPPPPPLKASAVVARPPGQTMPRLSCPCCKLWEACAPPSSQVLNRYHGLDFPTFSEQTFCCHLSCGVTANLPYVFWKTSCLRLRKSYHHYVLNFVHAFRGFQWQAQSVGNLTFVHVLLVEVQRPPPPCPLFLEPSATRAILPSFSQNACLRRCVSHAVPNPHD